MKDLVLRTPQQLIIIARLAEFCAWDEAVRRHATDPWSWMRDKLLQTEEALKGLKSELFALTSKRLLVDVEAGTADDERYADYKVIFDALLRRGDFADLSFHLDARAGKAALPMIKSLLARVKPTQLLEEERLPEAERNPNWERLVMQLAARLELDKLELALTRKPRTPRRRAMALHRLRRNVREYCSVMRVPLSAGDTFTPFMLPRVEALIAACLRLLNRYR